MRDIKFRAWNRDTSNMDYPSHSVAIFPFMGCVEYLKDVIVRPAIHNTKLMLPHNGDIMQFTGLLDKNGKEIYEGDIVLVPNNDFEPDNGDNSFHIKVVEYHAGEFGMDFPSNKKISFREKGGWESLKDYWVGENNIEDVEIIGNIYENNELLD